jgi:ribonucrease Y
MENILVGLVGALASAAIVYVYVKPKLEETADQLRRKNQDLIDKARHKAKEIEYAAKDEAVKAKEKAMNEISKAKEEAVTIRSEIEKAQASLGAREETLKEKASEIEIVQTRLKDKEADLEEKIARVREIESKEVEKLENIAKLTQEEAKEEMLTKIEQLHQDELAAKLHQVQEDIEDQAEEKARGIIVQAIQRYASDVTAESTSTTVELPSDEIKGRIIGREGRNINAFEMATGVDVIVDDTPGTIVLSGFDLLRRYVAKVTLEKLIEDGRIHPAKIEETLMKVKEDVAKMVKDFGEKAVLEVGLTGIHPNLVKLIGRLRFRTSFGQNVLKHSLEVGFLAAALASEVGANEEVAKKGGFLHDIGKAVTHEVEGPHALIGRDILRKFKVSEPVIHCVAAHHDDEAPETVEALIVQAADAISASRPGARRESLDGYIKRMKDLEEAAGSFEGVKKTFAIQAGREVRVIVEPKAVSDLEMVKLTKDITKKIEDELDYPGQIKVNVIRETREVEYAK